MRTSLHRRPRSERRPWFGRRLIRRNWLRRTTIALMVLVLLLGGVAVSGYEYANYKFHEAHFVTVKDLEPVKTSGPHANAVNILLIGSTSRCVLNNQQTTAFGSCDAGVTGVNSDVVMLLHADPNTHRVSILSLPRDLVLENVRPSEFHKVDAALADGPNQLVDVIEQDFGIPVNHYIDLNFDSFQQVVNAVGGVPMYFPDPVSDNMSSLNVTASGCYWLTGFQALAVVRARHMTYVQDGVPEYDGSGDLGRIVRDHEFLRVLASAVAAKGFLDPVRDDALLSAVIPDLTLDSTFTLSDMAHLILDFHAVNPNDAPETTLPTIEDHQDYMYQGYDYGSVVLPSYPQDQTAIDQWLGVSAPPAANVSPSSVTVSVEDGFADPSGTATTEAQLRSLGYAVSDAGSVIPVGPIAETTVFYSPGHLADGERVLQSLSGIVAMAEGATVGGADVTVVTGSEYSVTTQPAVSTTALDSWPLSVTALTGPTHLVAAPAVTESASSATIASSSAASQAASYLGPVSSAIETLPSYDPRACSASQITAIGH
jgi:LCP family protein required for cell wall assembly